MENIKYWETFFLICNNYVGAHLSAVDSFQCINLLFEDISYKKWHCKEALYKWIAMLIYFDVWPQNLQERQETKSLQHILSLMMAFSFKIFL